MCFEIEPWGRFHNVIHCVIGLNLPLVIISWFIPTLETSLFSRNRLPAEMSQVSVIETGTPLNFCKEKNIFSISIFIQFYVIWAEAVLLGVFFDINTCLRWVL